MNCVNRSKEKEEKERKTTCRSIAQTQVSVLDALLSTCLLLLCSMKLLLWITVFFRLDRHDYDTSLLDNNVPPRFTLPLIDQVKKVRETVELTVTGKLLVVGSSTTINIESDLK